MGTLEDIGLGDLLGDSETIGSNFPSSPESVWGQCRYVLRDGRIVRIYDWSHKPTRSEIKEEKATIRRIPAEKENVDQNRGRTVAGKPLEEPPERAIALRPKAA